MKCPVCSAELPSTARFCGSCGTTLTAPPPPPPQPQSYDQPPPRPVMTPSPSWSAAAPPSVAKKYKVLRLIAVLMKILAVAGGAILIIAGLVMLIAGAASGGRTASTFDPGPAAMLGGVVGGLGLMLYGVFVFVFLYAYAEWMYVFMDIEENTRVTNEVLLGKR